MTHRVLASSLALVFVCASSPALAQLRIQPVGPRPGTDTRPTVPTQCIGVAQVDELTVRGGYNAFNVRVRNPFAAAIAPEAIEVVLQDASNARMIAMATNRVAIPQTPPNGIIGPEIPPDYVTVPWTWVSTQTGSPPARITVSVRARTPGLTVCPAGVDVQKTTLPSVTTVGSVSTNCAEFSTRAFCSEPQPINCAPAGRVERSLDIIRTSVEASGNWREFSLVANVRNPSGLAPAAGTVVTAVPYGDTSPLRCTSAAFPPRGGRVVLRCTSSAPSDPSAVIHTGSVPILVGVAHQSAAPVSCAAGVAVASPSAGFVLVSVGPQHVYRQVQ